MRNQFQFKTLLCALVWLALAAIFVAAAEPGNAIPPASAVNDQKPGSVLFYSYFTSNAASPSTRDTRLTITNTSTTSAVTVHLFYVDGATCNVSDNFLCLTQNQTRQILASNEDPGITGYVVAVAVNSAGCPRRFNSLVGSAAVRLANGGRAEYGAEAVAALFGNEGDSLPCPPDATTVTLNFDGVAYNQLPRALALDKIGGAPGGNVTLLVVNRIGGDLSTGAARLGPLFGILYDNLSGSHSFSIDAQTCQLAGTLSDDLPRTVPPFQTVIPAGATGWLKLWQETDGAILGVAINFNDWSRESRGTFNGGEALHKLTLTSAGSLILPLIVPDAACVN